MENQWHGGKGSSRRTLSVSQQEYEQRWDAIFCRDLEQEEKEQTQESLTDKTQSDTKK